MEQTAGVVLAAVMMVTAMASAGCGSKEKTGSATGSGSGSATGSGPFDSGLAGAPPALRANGTPAPTSGTGTGTGAVAAARPDRGVMPAAYRKALQEGRKLAAAKKWAEAAASFRAALAEVPDDPRALSELSWALFQAKDPEARAVAEQAVKVGKNQVKAASLYNLGRILEAEGNQAEAANAYRESLEMRPNKTVAQHLAAVAPGEAPASVLAIEEWGPPAARPATCDALGDDGEGFADWSQDGACEVVATDVAITGERGPFQAVSALVRKRSGSDEAFIAVQTDGGWLLSPPFLSWGGVGTWGATGSITRAEVVTHPVLGPVLRVDVKTGESGRWESWDTEATVFCTASRPGGSGALTCTPLLPTSWLHTQDDDEAVDESCAATASLDASGAVVVTARGARAPIDCPIRVGRFTWPLAR